MITTYGLSNIIDEDTKLSKTEWNTVRRRIIKFSEDNLKSKFKEHSKLREGPLTEGGLEIKPYVQSLKLHEARTMFRIRTMMTPAKLNM